MIKNDIFLNRYHFMIWRSGSPLCGPKLSEMEVVNSKVWINILLCTIVWLFKYNMVIVCLFHSESHVSLNWTLSGWRTEGAHRFCHWSSERIIRPLFAKTSASFGHFLFKPEVILEYDLNCWFMCFGLCCALERNHSSSPCVSGVQTKWVVGAVCNHCWAKQHKCPLSNAGSSACA